ncbi:srp40-suppressor of mutant ac40 of rna polymerase i and iii [Fusarium flagelliforme]|uniref:Srp40-suppressor of mutant ac40 of rna polymerase i and iii n=1 Tax=Fusarium flagelliforme TaxID=2675880 RepID=A0A395MMI1_9HYPO|nr:srp40-suppressor of mutant ac40 of rna polymerase i and iii [Fusarium flagelliforme]
MSSQTIRLRLIIRRHAVPEVKLVWPCIANDDLTVSKLLALVNEVVPLESADWGLEDYVVELADGKGDSFELLHFQPVGKVLKEDDQVLSLSTEDLKRRRLSGRHQISYDGKHLIDGLAFGRPWLRAPRDRPALDLPPRKRARITHEEEEDDDSYADEEAASEQLLLEGSSSTEDREEPDSVRLRARFVDTDQLGEEDEEMDDDTDFQLAHDQLAEPEVEEDEDSETSDEDEPDADLADELKLLQEDNALIEQGSEQEEISSPDNIQEAQTAPAPMFDLSMLDKITALRTAFPFTSMSTMQDALRDHDLKETYQILAKTNSPTVSYDEVLEIAFLGAVFNPPSKQQGPEEDGDEEENENEEEEAEVEEPTLRLPGQPEADSKRPLIQEVNDDESPSKAPTPIQAKTKSLISVVDDGDDTSSSSSSSDSDSDSDSESDEESHDSPKEDSDSDSDSDSSDDSSDDGLDDRPKDASSSDSSDSDSDSDVAPRLVKVAKATDTSGAQDSDSSDSSSDSDSSSSDSDSESEPEELSSKKAAEVKQSRAAASPEVKTQDTKPPGAGLVKTKKRNARRRDLKRLRAMQALEDTQSQPSTNGAASEDAEFLARKRALLSVVSDESENVPSPPKETTATGPSPMIVEVETEETPAPATTQDAATTEDSAQRRHKVDMGAGRRMLFGALGLKNPKSKAEEDKLRKSLMKDVKPLQNPRVQPEEAKVNGVEPTAEQKEEDPEAWRKVISYRAVECCQEGVILSEPPFPFVQRWDPQQQYSSMRKRKRASQDFNDDSYYGEGSQWNGDEEWQEEDTQKKKKKKSKKRKGKGGYDGGYDEMEITEDSYAETGANGNDEEDIVLNYDDIPKPRLQDTQFTEMDDLPTLPPDLTTLPSLALSDAKPGMVITWKQLLMSKATKWQPEMVSMTGLVLSIDQDNCLHVLLAKRDRDEDDKEYDEHTGQRVYAKFEVPDLDDDDDGEEDNGRREIAWEEMSEPRLVQPAPSDDSSETLAKGKELLKEHAKPAQDDSMANNKVSTPTHPDETMAEELDTQKVRAEVEADLKDREAATADRPSGTDKSISIPSGQQPPRLEFMGFGDNSPISSFVRPMEGLSDMTNSPTRQLRETIEEVPLTKALEDFISNVEEKKDDEADGAKDANDLDDAMLTVEAGWDTIIPDSMPSLDLPPLSKKDDVPADHRMLMVPSSAGSVRSGRQPPSVSGLEDLPEERIEDSVVDNGPHKRTPSPQISAVSVRSSSPFPSLEEIFATARQTQSPAKFSQPSVPRFLKTEKRDVEYEEAMRKLDEGEDESDRSHDRNKSLRSLFKHATQEKSPLQQSIKSEVVQNERTAAPPPSQKIKEESQSMVLEGSQVIELSSSPPYAEHYAEDNEDETYDDGPLPQGSGWVQKNYSEVKTRSRGKSLPATAAKEVKDKTTTTTQARTARGRTSLPPARAVTASAFSQIRGRRKPTRKF